MKVLLTGLLALCAACAYALEIPKESGKALGVTKGRSFTSGFVFVNGKYLPPPYVVERWGVGIRINGVCVVGEVVPWNDFLKTQSGVQKVTAEPAPAAAETSASAETPQPEPEQQTEDDSTDMEESLDDLFDDNPKPKKKKKASKPKTARKPTVVRKPAPVSKPAETLVLSGEFQQNLASAELLKRVRAARTEIDAHLRAGGFICFGDRYKRIDGDSRLAEHFIGHLPAIQREAKTFETFSARVQAADMVYVSQFLREDLYRNRVDYRKLMERDAKMKSDRAINRLLSR